MAETPQETSQQNLQEQADLFKALADAYSFIHAQENMRALAGTTFRDCLQARINEIRGPHPYGLPPLLEETDKIKANFDAAIVRLRATAAETEET